MRIGISALLTEGGRSGIGQYILNLLEALQQVDQENRYVVFGLAGDRSLDGVTAPNFTIVRIPDFFHRPVRSIVWHWIVLPILARRWRLDLIHLPSYRRLCPLSPCPVVVTVHDLAILRDPAKYGHLRHLYAKNIVRRLLSRSAQIITVSNSTGQDVLAFVGLRPDGISVVHNGIDHKRYYPMDRAYCCDEVARRYGIRRPFILCVARLEHPGKNLVRLIEAFTRLKGQTGLPHQLVLAGARWNRVEAIYRAAGASGFAEDIVFSGFVPAEDLPLLYNAADLFVLPSINEGFGLPILEAMACGAPVTCANTSSIPEVAGDAALYFDPHEPNAIAQAILKLLEDREIRKALVSKGLERAARFSWEETARRTAALYREVRDEFRGA